MINNNISKKALHWLLESIKPNWVSLERETSIKTKNVQARYHVTLKRVYIIIVTRRAIL